MPIQEDEILLSVIFNNVPLIMILVDENGNVLKVNRTGLSITGKTEKQAIGLQYGDIVNCKLAVNSFSRCGSGEDCSVCSLRNTILDTLKSGRRIFKKEIILPVIREGSVSLRYLLISTDIFPMNNHNRVLISLTDVTDQKMASLELTMYKEKLEEIVEERTTELRIEIEARKQSEKELKRYATELENFNSTMIDREIRIMEMKKEVNNLCRELGKPISYEEFWHERNAGQ